MQSMKFKALQLATAGLAIAAAVTSASADTILTDGTFSNITNVLSNPPGKDWFAPQNATDGGLGTETVNFVGVNSGFGNPAPSLYFSVTNNSYTGGTLSPGAGILDNLLTYNPSVSGAISSINASADKYLSATNPPQTLSSGFRILAYQGGNYYMSSTSVPINQLGDWESISALGLTANSFNEICLVSCGTGGFANTSSFPAGSNPNFSASGGLITFGLLFFVGSSSGYLSTPGSSVTSAFDNLSLDISQTPLPSTWAMLLGGFALLGFFLYRGRNQASGGAALA